ncbi:MAG: hypothetical protein EZS28_005274 [Streblomastix strix]|uniref:Uncharacterized protein n=1 Tax=Streblomastix strix TaxID=222440 RepID=A0A5J4WXB2_9EUKA|nr:MAG: hypothetical protein EZS28_005274 [Streblomastix strix]
MSRKQQQYVEVAISTTLDRRSASSISQHITNKNCNLHVKTGLGTEEANYIQSYRLDQVQARNNATRAVSRSLEETNARNPTDCVFTAVRSVTTVRPDSLCTIQSFYIKPPQQQIQRQQPLQYPIQYSIYLMQYPIQPTTFDVILPLNQFLPTMNPPQTHINEPQLSNTENERSQQNWIQLSQQVEYDAIQTVERLWQKTTNKQKCTLSVKFSNSSISATTNFSNTIDILHNRERLVVKTELKINISITQES